MKMECVVQESILFYFITNYEREIRLILTFLARFCFVNGKTERPVSQCLSMSILIIDRISQFFTRSMKNEVCQK